MGRSHAVRLAEEGADLILVDICESLPEIEYPLATREDLEETARLVEKHGRRAVTHVVDVRDAAALAAAVDDGVAQLGGLDASVANAGVLTVGTWDTTTPEQWRTVVDVNLIGTWNTCAAALPHLVERGGSLVNISSAAGLKGTPLHTPYTASKHGVVGLSRALANELAAQNIRVNTVHPTGVETGMQPASLHGLLAEHAPTWSRSSSTPCRSSWPRRSTSATRCCSWSPTNPGTSPGWNSKSTPASPCGEQTRK